MKNKKLISFVSCIALFSSLNAKEFSLDDLLEIALNNNTQIQVSKYNKQIKQEELKKSKAAYLPQIIANADIGQYDIEASGIKQDGKANSVSLSANQLIYDFGKTSSSIEASKYNLEASNSDITTSKKDTILSIKQAYYDILNEYQQIVVNEESVKLDQLQLSQAKAYFKAGVRTQIDVTNARLKLSNSKLKLVQSRYDLKIAKTKLISLLGKNIDKNIQIKTENKDIKILAKQIKLKKDNLDKLINTALKNKAEIKKLQAVLQTNKASLKGVNAQYYPSLNLSAAYSDKNSDDIASLDSKQGSVLLNLKWDLYTGNTTRANKKISLANIHTSLKQLEQKKLEIRQDITDAYLNLQQSYESVNINVLSLDLATTNLNLANERYKSGLNDLLEVNDAKLEYTQAKTNLVNAYYVHLKNQANLDYALGL